MSTLRQRQVEALTELYHYNQKLLEALPGLIEGLKDSPEEELLSYLSQFLQGLNWEIQVTNGCRGYINKEKIRLNLKQVSNTIEDLNQSYLEDDYSGVAEILENGVEAYLTDMREIARELT